VAPIDLAACARAAERAADRARVEIAARFRRVAVETKGDGSPVTEADRAAERAIRDELQRAFPDFGILGEEFGAEGDTSGPRWVIDPIDGTIGFSRGLPLYSTLIGLVDGDQPVLGLIDVPGIGERIVGWQGGGCRRNGEPVRISQERDLRRAIVSHGDPFCFDLYGARPVFTRMAREIPILRGYTDAFGHALVLGGGVDAMVDLHLNAWDAAPTQVLVPEAGGRCVTLPARNGKIGLVFGSPALVEILVEMFETAARAETNAAAPEPMEMR
jgi:histidinol phosphatase-like enzyme (inositol monophosphatase family)